MSEVWALILKMVQFAVQGFKSIPVWEGNGYTVYLWEFLIALLILTIVSTATVSVVTVAPGMAYSKVQKEKQAAERQAQRDARAAERKKK